MTRRVAVERRRHERRIHDDDDRFWRKLHGERRVEERREIEKPDELRAAPGTIDAAKPINAGPAAVTDSIDATADKNFPASRAGEVQSEACDGALEQDTISRNDGPDSTSDFSPGADEAAMGARRAALRSMLDAAEARVAKAQRMRRPILAKGSRVRVTRGQHAGREGIIEDADYIESRALLRLDPARQPCWIGFSRLGRALTDD